MRIYRLEHRSSRLGPFMHKSSRQKSPDQSVLSSLYTCARAFMPDISDLQEVKDLLQHHPKAVFGWDSLDRFERMIKDCEKVKRLGFRLCVYNTKPLYHSDCGQVLFEVPAHITTNAKDNAMTKQSPVG